MSQRVYNFSAGPAVLPEEVLKKAASEMLDYRDSGMSVMEMSHRSGLFEDIINEAGSLLRELMNIPNNYEVLFLQGGASTQFLMVPLNLMNASKKVDYVNTGAWSKKAIAEAKKQGDVKVVTDSSDKTFSYIPEIHPADIREDTSYFHITSNNTIYGTKYSELPKTSAPIVSDMSSGILSEVIDVSDYGLIYAGAQKNIGPSGVTVVIIRKDLIGNQENLPTMLDYKTHVDGGSMFNTPPTYGIYIAKLVFEYIKEKGGVAAMQEINKRKANMIYNAIDESKLFKAHVQNEKDRSLMNIPFFADSDEINKKFIIEAEARGLVTLKGHRSVGGMRASIYNAMPIEGCEKLTSFIQQFDSQNS
jgi:phosphoserine aminotransferase